MAVGLMVLFVIVQAAFGVAALVAIQASGRKFEISDLVLLNAVAVIGGSLALAAMFLHGQFVRALAIRRLNPLHAVILLAMVWPLVIVNLACAGWLMEALEAADAQAAQVEDTSTEPFTLDPSENLFDQMNSMYAEMAEASWPVILVFFCLFPAVGEEMFFRGLLGRGLVARFGVGGLVIASIFFGLSHLDPVRVLATTALGMALHAVYLATRTFWAPVLLHFCNNALVFSSYKLMDDEGNEPLGISRFDIAPPSPVLIAGAALALAALGWMLYQTRTRWVLPDGAAWNPGYATPEMPPKELHARPQISFPSVWAVLAALASLAAFVWLYASGY
jgi:membrane protease YdiL (CAAX protease family)